MIRAKRPCERLANYIRVDTQAQVNKQQTTQQSNLVVVLYVALHGGSRSSALKALNAASGADYSLSRLGEWLNRKRPLPPEVRAVMLPPVANHLAALWIPKDAVAARRIAGEVVRLACD